MSTSALLFTIAAFVAANLLVLIVWQVLRSREAPVRSSRPGTSHAAHSDGEAFWERPFADASIDVVEPGADTLPYRKKDYLFTVAERSFYGVLSEIIGGEALIFAKVRLADLLWLPQTSNRQAHLNRVVSKHVDFVICNRTTVTPMLAIELDDSSHRLEHRQKRDAFVDAVLCTADIPLLRVPVQRGYRTKELAAAIRERIDAESQPAATELEWPDCLFSTLTGGEPAS